MIPAILDFDNYRSYEGETAPTTYAQMQTYMSNQNKIIKAIVATHLWQPATTYIVGQVVYSNSMTLNTCARCIVAGTSAENDEPTWGTVIGAQISGDGGVTWEIIATSADAWIPGQSVALGKTIRPLSIANGCVACCTTAGTTSSTTVPTWTSVSMGGTITDGTVVWTIMANEYVYAEGTGFIVRQHYNANTGAWVSVVNNGMPVGTVIDYAGSTAPNGYLVCDGSAVSRTTYADLFAVIGTNFGVGDSSTTFNLPNLIDKFKQGSTTVGTVKSAGLPNIKGQVSATLSSQLFLHFQGTSGAFYSSNTKSTPQVSLTGNPSDGDVDLYFNASTYNSIYSDSATTVQPPALTVLPCIKY